MSVPPGTRFGPHEIISRIAAGGMGEVYSARDLRIGREVAIKILPSSFSQDKERLQRFEREARAVSILNHPNILTLFDVGVENGSPYLVLELLNGETLRARLLKGPLAPRKAADFAKQIAQGLTAAHEKGIIHRDLKPENVFITKDGRIKLLDFGLAKLKQPDAAAADVANQATIARHTDEGIVLGTVFYMSPEQIRGKELDHRSDIFSFGMILYEMLAGKHPFHGQSNVQVIRSILEVDPPPITETSDVSPALERIALRCLEKNPDQRFQSAGDLCFALESLSSITSAGLPMQPKKSRKTLPIALALILCIALMLIWKYLRMPAVQDTHEPFEKMRILRLTTSGKVVDATISPDGKYFAYVTQDGNAQSLSVRPVASTTSVTIVPPKEVQYQGITFSPDGNSIYYVMSPLDSPRGTASQVPVLGGSARRVLDDVYGPIFLSPDGSTIAFLGNSGLMLSDASGSHVRKLVEMSPGKTLGPALAWSPDNAKIAAVMEDPSGYRDKLVTIDVTDGKQIPVGSTEWFDIHRASWLPDGSGFVVAAKETADGYRNYQVWQLSYPAGRTTRITNDLNDYRGLSMTTDASRMIAVRLEQSTNIWIVPRNAQPRQIKSESTSLDGLWGLSWAANGDLIYTSIAGGDEDLWTMGPDGSNPKQLTNASWSEIAPIRCGAYAAFMSRGRVGAHIWRIGLDGRGLQQVTNTSSEGLPACSEDGQDILYVSAGAGGWTLWKIGSERSAVRLTNRPSLSPAVSPDGKWVAYVFLGQHNQKSIGIIPAQGGDPTKSYPLSSTALVDIGLGLRWTSDGRAITYVDTKDGVSNIWVQPLDGRSAKQLTHFTSGEIFAYDLSLSGDFAMSRGTLSRDAVLIENFR